ncbi:hypothetical protein Gogos_016640 [Gossypium gossypioides]|uniref:Uncharacterized protein n=1 Tax=Gossypium gossypioides TaxID=34282 RepID=A0A7J9B8F5_GOSGO|nr:hypothetical protein [Gossypium gossypioides]
MVAATNGAEQIPTETIQDIVEELLEAARYDDLDDLIRLASIGVSLDSKDSQGRTERKKSPLPSPVSTRPTVSTQSGSFVQLAHSSSGGFVAFKGSTKWLSPSLMVERKQKGLYFCCEAKYHIGHKCVKSQLYQMLLESPCEEEVEEFQECSNKLDDLSGEGEQPQTPTLSLHAIKGSQGPHTIRFEAN